MSEITPTQGSVAIDLITVSCEWIHGPLFVGIIGLFRRLSWWLHRKRKTRATEARMMVNGKTVLTFKNLRDYATSVYPQNPPLIFNLDDVFSIEIFPSNAYYAPVIEIRIRILSLKCWRTL